MKKVLLTFLMASLCHYLQAQTAACSLTNFTIKFKTSTPPNAAGKTNLTVDIYWYQDVNYGNKFSYVNLWEESSYKKFDYKNPEKVPKNADLSKALGSVVIMDDKGTLLLANNYNPDSTYKRLLTVMNTGATITKTNIKASTDMVYIANLVLPGVTYNADNLYALTGDVWSSQHAQGLTTQCYTQKLSIDINKYADRSVLVCNNPDNKLKVEIASKKSDGAGIYTVYVDANDNKFIDASDILLTTSDFKTTATSPIDNSYPYTYTGPTINIPALYRSKQLMLIITGQTKASDVATATLSSIFNPCSPLPVAFKSFTANRDKQVVVLKWETVSEQDNKGFYVQRLVNSEWKDIALVFSKAADGNSSVLLTYEYKDANTVDGVTQYRLLQMDYSGKARFSEVRTAAGAGQGSKVLVFPNPSTGTIHIIMDSPAVRDVVISDINGRLIRQYTCIAATLTVENLTTGFYTVKISDRSTGTASVQKVIIK